MEHVSDDTPTMRAADNDREAVVERLTRAQAEGRLDLAEFDHRTQLAWAAQTYAELAALVADLPTDGAAAQRSPAPAYVPPPYQPAYLPRPAAPGVPGKAGNVLVRTWLAVSMINFVVWGLVCVTEFEWVYPWWIWVAGPWGALVLAARMTRFGQPR